jgi:hypothetical protein
MNLQQRTINELQQHLDTDTKEREHFVNAVVESDSEDSEEKQEIRVLAPRRKNKKGRMDELLMEQLLFQQKQTLKAQKKIYELQTEIYTEEVKTRYIKLDLNNLQVKNEEIKDKLSKTKVKLSQSEIENWITRVLIFVYIFWSVYAKIINIYS